MELRNIVQEAVIKTISKKKKCKKAKRLSEEALQIAEKRRAAKGKGEKETYIHLNAEFQRIARRDKKAFLSEQCREGNNRMIKTRDHFKKIRDTEGRFHAKMNTIKDTHHAKKFRKISSGHRTGKGQFSFQSQRRAMPKNVQLPQNCTHLTRK